MRPQDDLELRGVAPLPGSDHDGLGFRPCSTARCSLVVRPPRERPRPWSPGSVETPPGGSFCRSPFFPAPAACWWARTMVESTLISQVIRSLASARTCRAVKIRCQVPLRFGDQALHLAPYSLRRPRGQRHPRAARPQPTCRCRDPPRLNHLPLGRVERTQQCRQPRIGGDEADHLLGHRCAVREEVVQRDVLAHRRVQQQHPPAV